MNETVTREQLKKAFSFIEKHPLLGDVTSLTPRFEDVVVHLHDQNGHHRVSLPLADYEAIIDGEGNPPQMSLNLVARELKAHIKQLMGQKVSGDKTNKIMMLQGALTLVCAVYDGMTNEDRVAKVKSALEKLNV